MNDQATAQPIEGNRLDDACRRYIHGIAPSKAQRTAAVSSAWKLAKAIGMFALKVVVAVAIFKAMVGPLALLALAAIF